MSQRARLAIDDLETKLHSYLGIPLPARATEGMPGQFTSDCGDLLLELRSQLTALRRESDRIGRIPQGYPRHVTWIMRVMSALLPWYTRPLVNFGRHASATAELTSDLLDAVLQRQDALAEEIQSLRSVR